MKPWMVLALTPFLFPFDILAQDVDSHLDNKEATAAMKYEKRRIEDRKYFLEANQSHFGGIVVKNPFDLTLVVNGKRKLVHKFAATGKEAPLVWLDVAEAIDVGLRTALGKPPGAMLTEADYGKLEAATSAFELQKFKVKYTRESKDTAADFFIQPLIWQLRALSK